MFYFHSSILWWEAWQGRFLAVQAGATGVGPFEKAAAPQTKAAAAQLDENCCAIFRTRAVLAESPAFVCCAKRDLIFSRGLSRSRPRSSYAIEKAELSLMQGRGPGMSRRNIKGQRRGSGGRPLSRAPNRGPAPLYRA